jgi:hypothetical protein
VFYHDAVIYLCAESLGCELLTTEALQRLDFCCQKQIHTKNTERVYRDDNLKDFRQMIVENIACTIVHGVVKAMPMINKLKRDLMGGVFGKDLDAEVKYLRDQEKMVLPYHLVIRRFAN